VRPLVVSAVIAVALAAAGAGAAAVPRCGAPPDTVTAVEAVFGHFGTRAQAEAYARKVRGASFRFVEVQQEGCGDWQVFVAGLNTPRQQREFAAEAAETGFPGISFETTADPAAPAAQGTVKAVFGAFTTIGAAERARGRAASAGFRQVDIARMGLRSFKVVVLGIPVKQTRAFAAQARAAGLSITFDL
jgi:hypothetical protein